MRVSEGEGWRRSTLIDQPSLFWSIHRDKSVSGLTVLPSFVRLLAVALQRLVDVVAGAPLSVSVGGRCPRIRNLILCTQDKKCSCTSIRNPFLGRPSVWGRSAEGEGRVRCRLVSVIREIKLPLEWEGAGSRGSAASSVAHPPSRSPVSANLLSVSLPGSSSVVAPR